MAESIMRKVERFRDSIAAAKTDKTRLETRLEAVDTDLKTKFDADNPNQAQDILTKEKVTEVRLGKEVAAGLGTLEERFDW